MKRGFSWCSAHLISLSGQHGALNPGYGLKELSYKDLQGKGSIRKEREKYPLIDH